MSQSDHRHHLNLIQQMLCSYSIGARLCDAKYVNIMGLAGECGEVTELLKKHYRDGTPLSRSDLKAELGDVNYYLNAIANDYQLTMADIVDGTLNKLADRRKRNVLSGKGDHR